MSAKVREAVEDLRRRRGPAVLRPRLDLEALDRLPAGSAGRELADFYRANAIVPARISERLDDARVARLPAAARYICLHDLFHVLLGCDTSIPEELRITAFILEQGYFKASALWIPLLYLVGLLARPHLVRRTYHNIRIGRALARRAPLLLAEPLEDYLDKDLATVRRQLHLTLDPAPLAAAQDR